MWVRSSKVVRASDWQCRSRNIPGFDTSILRHSGISGAADEAVLNKVHIKQITKIPLFIMYSVGLQEKCRPYYYKNPVKSCGGTSWQLNCNRFPWKGQKWLPIFIACASLWTNWFVILRLLLGKVFKGSSSCTILGQYSRSERITRQEVLKLIFPKQLIKDQSYVV